MVHLEFLPSVALGQAKDAPNSNFFWGGYIRIKSSEAHGVVRKFCIVCYWEKWYSCGVADRGRGDSYLVRRRLRGRHKGEGPHSQPDVRDSLALNKCETYWALSMACIVHTSTAASPAAFYLLITLHKTYIAIRIIVLIQNNIDLNFFHPSNLSFKTTGDCHLRHLRSCGWQGNISNISQRHGKRRGNGVLYQDPNWQTRPDSLYSHIHMHIPMR